MKVIEIKRPQAPATSVVIELEINELRLVRDLVGKTMTDDIRKRYQLDVNRFYGMINNLHKDSGETK